MSVMDAGALRVCERNPRYFTDGSGKAIYMTGSHTWAVHNDIWVEGEPRRSMDYEGFLDMLQQQGHNYLRYWQWQQTRGSSWSDDAHPVLFGHEPYMRSGVGSANDGGSKFDLTRFNQEYFDRLRAHVLMAGERGIYVQVMFFECWSIKWSATRASDGWLCHPYHPANNINAVTDDPLVPYRVGNANYVQPSEYIRQTGLATNLYSLKCPQLLELQKAYIRKCVDTLNDIDSVLFEIANEMPDTQEALDWANHLCAYVKEYESKLPKQHPVGVTAEGGDQQNEPLFQSCADYISPGNGNRFEYRYNPPVSDGSKVILLDTDHLWGHGGEAIWVWKAMLRGHNPLFMDPWEPVPGEMVPNFPGYGAGGSASPNSRYYYQWDPVRRAMGDARRAVLRLKDLTDTVPRGDICSSGYCLANPGEDYIMLFPDGAPNGFYLDAAGQYEGLWIDVESGIPSQAGPFEGERRYLAQPPMGRPAALQIKRKG